MTEGQHQRTYRFALAGLERRALQRLAAGLPGWVMPDHLTVLGLVAATFIAAAYLLTNVHPGWLWAASAGLVVQWYGDSLDGTLARYRKIERPRYGFYLDHLTDAYSTIAIGLGLGLSPYMLLSVGLAIIIAYLVLSINVYLETHVYKKFDFGYGIMGPTEVRLVLIAVNTTAVIIGPMPFVFLGVDATVFDVFGIATVLVMMGLLMDRVVRNLRNLGSLEPPGVRREAES
jgi:phosphatidylglycerophosphate synthase